jgi:RHS repeat-associated protein
VLHPTPNQRPPPRSLPRLLHTRYDVENRWIGENIDVNGDGQIDHATRFAYDGNQIVLQFDKDVSGGAPAGSSGSPLTVGNLSHRYLWQPGVVDQLMADERTQFVAGASGGESGTGSSYDLSQPGTVVWPLADNLGTVRDLAICDAQTGVTSVANHRVFDSYGNLVSQTNAAVDCLFGYTGRAYDSNTKLQNNLNRWYDGKTGQWVSKDPIAFSGGDANQYRYVGNSQTNATDPSGLEPSPGTPENGYNGLGEWEFKTREELIKFLSAILEPSQKGFPPNWTGTAEKGCIGLATLRIGWGAGRPPITPLSYPGAEFYVDYDTALARLKELNGKNDGKHWLLIAVQVPVRGDPDKVIKKFGTGKLTLYQVPIDLDKLQDADYNWATWFGGYWEYMNTHWQTIDPKKLPKVIHSKKLPNMGRHCLQLYMIVEQRGWR